MKIAFFLMLLSLSGCHAYAQTLPSGQPRGLLVYEGGLKEARISSEPVFPLWISKCDPPYYQVFSIRTTPTARVLLSVFIGGSAREEVITYRLIPETVKSCAAISNLNSYTVRRPTQMAKGEYSEIFPVLNAENEVKYLLHEEKSFASTGGGVALARTLLALTEKSFKQVARITKTDVDAAQSADAVIPFASLLK